MAIDALEDGKLCTYCGTPVFFSGEGMTDCQGCGIEWVNAEDDPADSKLTLLEASHVYLP